MNRVRLSLNRAVIGEQRIHSTIEYTDRCMPLHIMHLVHHGSIDRMVNGERIVSGAGSFFWISPAIAHDFTFHTGTEHTVIQFSIRGRTSPQGYIALDNAGHLDHHFRRIAGEARRADERAIHHMFTLLLIDIMRAMQGKAVPIFTARQEQVIRGYIRTHADEHTTSAHLSEALGLSQDHFSRIFTRSYGVSPRTFILTEVMRMAAFDISGGSSVGAAAERYGYDIYTFSRLFKKVFGQSPVNFRREHGIMEHG